MTLILPHTIQNKHGEKLIFHRIESEPDGDRLIVENFVSPNAGPPMHVHFQQEESLTVVSGKIGYQMLGQEAQYAGPGDTIEFRRGVPHRFWNAGTDTLNCMGWVKPVNTFMFFLGGIYNAIDNSKSPQPELFDSAYLLHRYRREYDMLEIPAFVKKVVFPIAYGLGTVLGKYRKFQNAPQPL